jgi:hypothetical protein
MQVKSKQPLDLMRESAILATARREKRPSCSLVAYDGDIDLSSMRGAAMLEDKDPLPGSECHSSTGDGNHLACPSECHSQVACRVVGSFQGVNIVAALGDDFLEVVMQVGPGARVGVFENDEAGAGMADKNRHCARSNAAFAYGPNHFIGDLISSLAPRVDVDRLVLRGHCGLITTSSQPARNNKPPIGVIAPSQRILVTARR